MNIELTDKIEGCKMLFVKSIYLRALLEYLFCLIISAILVTSFSAKGNSIVYFSFALMLILDNKLFKIYFLSPFFILSIIYMPVGFFYGPPNIGIIHSLLESNPRESIEFIGNLPLITYGILIIQIALYWIFITNTFTPYSKLKLRLTFTIALMLYPKTSPIYQFVSEGITSFKEHDNVLSQLTTSMKNKYIFKIKSINSKYKTYVVVIGESMRKDYMSVYGYHRTTTPFLNKVNGLFVDGYISTAAYTSLSLPRTLSLSEGIKVDYQKNFISLANSASFETYWISNQGFIGDSDTAISKFAVLSQHVTFLKKGEYSSSGNHYDSELLPHFKSALENKTAKKNKLIILHLMGSHPQFSKRIKKDHYKLKHSLLSEYLSTYNETDQLLGNIYNELQKSKKSFSLLYFSDHGLDNQNRKKGDLHLKHGGDYKSNYEVPLIRLSSDDLSHVKVTKLTSAFHFMSFFSDWIGVSTPEINNFNLDTFTENSPIQIFNGQDMIPFHSLKNDPVYE